MKRFIIFILALFMTGISHSSGDFNKLKCESGVVIDVLGVPKDGIITIRKLLRFMQTDTRGSTMFNQLLRILF